MTAAVVTPVGMGSIERAQAWSVVKRHLWDRGYPVLTNPIDPYQQQWVKAHAVRAAIDAANPTVPDDTVLLIHDADVMVPAQAMTAAVQAVESGEYQWAIPHRLVWRLTRRATAQFNETGFVPEAAELERHPYIGVPGGGVVVLRRDLYDRVPLDPRFVGWGDEDVAWGWALHTLAGAPWRGDDHLVHLWHPHAAPQQRHNSDPEAVQLWRRYRAARDRPEQMAALVRHATTWAR